MAEIRIERKQRRNWALLLLLVLLAAGVLAYLVLRPRPLASAAGTADSTVTAPAATGRP